MSDFDDRHSGAEGHQGGAAVGRPPVLRRNAPVMTFALAIAIQLAAFAQFAVAGFRVRGEDYSTMPGDWALGAKVPSLVANGEYWRLITANFLHGSIWHLFINLVGLMIMGRLVELFYGPVRLLILFVLASVGGAIASYLWTPNMSLGASTGIMGLLGALIAHHTRYGRFLPPRVAGSLPWLIGLAILQTFMDTQSQQVDMSGHLGGLATGYVLGWMIEGRIAGKHQAEREWLPLPVGIASVSALLAYGALGLAIALPREGAMLRAASVPNARAQVNLIREIAAERPDFVEARQQLIELLALRGEVDEASQEYRSLLKDHPGYEKDEQTRAVLNVTIVRLLQRAHRDEEQGKYEEALAKSLLLLELAKGQELEAVAHNMYAWILADHLNRDLDKAEQHALRATAMWPEEAAFVDTLAWVYYRQGNYEKALPHQQRAVELADRVPFSQNGKVNGEVYYHLAAILEKLGRTSEAILYYGKAIGSKTATVPSREALQRLREAKPAPSAPTTPTPVTPVPSAPTPAAPATPAPDAKMQPRVI